MGRLAASGTRRTPAVTREVMAWFEPIDPALLSPFPVFIIESRHGMHYGIPPQAGVSAGAGIKVAKHHHRDETVDPDTYERTVTAADEAPDPPCCCRASTRSRWPAHRRQDLPLHHDARRRFSDRPHAWRTERHRRLSLLRPWLQVRAGHREILADLATAGTTRHDISRFLAGAPRLTANRLLLRMPCGKSV
jgi:hypothetical protein